jgi:hypothetical protein
MLKEKRWWIVTPVIILSLVVGAMAQSAFPVRLDSPPEEATSPPYSGAVMDFLHLPPLEGPPYDCTAEKIGSFYVRLHNIGGPPPDEIFVGLVCWCSGPGTPTPGLWQDLEGSGTSACN